jgi:5'-methylthioadenosine phosphorylase
MNMDARADYGIIGGTGLCEMDGFTNVSEIAVDTPFGAPSDRLIVGTLDEKRVAFMPRHGRGHRILPGELNFRANIFALKALGVQWVLSVSAVGSLKPAYAPQHIVIPDQLVDRTARRESTFFGHGLVAHVAFAHPFCNNLSRVLAAACADEGATHHVGGSYVCIEGPQFSTRAESELYRAWGLDLVGMTNLPEARLAREAELCYATLAMVTDYDCWHSEHDSVTVEQIIANLGKNAATVRAVLRAALRRLPVARDCECANALRNALVTSPDLVPERVKTQLDPIIGRYMREEA